MWDINVMQKTVSYLTDKKEKNKKQEKQDCKNDMRIGTHQSTVRIGIVNHYSSKHQYLTPSPKF